MDIVINKKNKQTADNLQDPTSMRTILHYMQSPSEEGIEFVAVVQEPYDMSEVVSGIMVPMDSNDADLGDYIKGDMTFIQYMEKLLTEGVIRLVFHPGEKDKMAKRMQPFIDETTDYDPDDAVMCIMLPPMYWVKLTGRKWR